MVSELMKFQVRLILVIGTCLKSEPVSVELPVSFDSTDT